MAAPTTGGQSPFVLLAEVLATVPEAAGGAEAVGAREGEGREAGHRCGHELRCRLETPACLLSIGSLSPASCGLTH